MASNGMCIEFMQFIYINKYNKLSIMNADEEDITYKILPVYRRKCESMGITVSPMIKSLLLAATDSGKF